MRRAFCNIRHAEHGQFAAGLRAAGFDVGLNVPARPRPDDVLLTWNRHGARDYSARLFETAGATVIVAENGWIGRAPDGGKMYALCLWHHNGRGAWQVGAEDRFAALGVDLVPWRARGDRVVILAQRGIGAPGVAMPRGWVEGTAKALKARTARPVVIRNHPGNDTDGKPPIADAVAGAHCVVTWASGAAIKAIAAGVPCFYGLPDWIGAPAAVPLAGCNLERPFLGDRLPMFHRLSWAQWSAAEIETGKPIEWLLKSRSMN